MRNLYLGILVAVALTVKATTDYAQLPETDSCKFAVSLGTNIPPLPLPGWLQRNTYPFYIEASYYLKPKTSFDVTVAPFISTIHYDFPAPESKTIDFFLSLNINRHPRITKWLNLLYGAGLAFQYDRSSYSRSVNTAYVGGPGISFGFEIELYKNLFFYDRTDIAYGWEQNTNYDENNENGSTPIVYRVLSTGLKLRF